MTIAWALLVAGLSLPTVDSTDGGYKLTPKYHVGQEVVYSGTLIESYIGKQGARYEQPYDLETTMLVSRIDARGNSEVGCFTIARLPSAGGDIENKGFDDVASFHFDQIKISPRGTPTWNLGAVRGAHIMMPADGIANWELGYLVEAPEEPVAVGGIWTIQRAGQPNVICRLAGSEGVDGEPCVKIVCTQQLPTWTNKIISQPTWRADTIAWVSQKNSLVYRLSRVHQVREPGDDQPSRKVTVNYNQASNLVYHGPELQERTFDLDTAAAAQSEYEKVAARTSERSPRNHLASIRHQLKSALEKPYATPYRSALEEMAKRVEDAEKHASSTTKQVATMPPALATASIGRKARPLAIQDLEKDELVTLKSLKGRAAAIVYVDPDSPLSTRALDAVVKCSKTPKGMVDIYAVSTKTDSESIQQMKRLAPGEYRICKPQAIDRGYGMAGAPHTIIIDADGILRTNFSGFGPELGVSVTQEVGAHGNPIEKIGSKTDKKSSFWR
jgi:hypothetical protein